MLHLGTKKIYFGQKKPNSSKKSQNQFFNHKNFCHMSFWNFFFQDCSMDQDSSLKAISFVEPHYNWSATARRTFEIFHFWLLELS